MITLYGGPTPNARKVAIALEEMGLEWRLSPIDMVLALVPPARRSTLIANRQGEGLWRFDIRLQGEHETVFFDV